MFNMCTNVYKISDHIVQLTLGDALSYVLTTAENELGVVVAISSSGNSFYSYRLDHFICTVQHSEMCNVKKHTKSTKILKIKITHRMNMR